MNKTVEAEAPKLVVKYTSDSGNWLPNGTAGECGNKITIINITGGKVTGLGRFPYMALLGYNSPGKGIIYGCGGSLINKWYVLTAAHCVHGTEIREIVLGDWRISTDPDCVKKSCVPKRITRKVDKIIEHEGFVLTDPRPENVPDGEYFRNDIALIRLDESVPLYYEDPSKSYAIPVCLPWPEYNENNHPAFDVKEFKDKNKTVHYDFVITGWGKRWKDLKLELDKQTFSDVLRKAKVPVTNNIPGCTKLSIDSTQICAGGINGPHVNGPKDHVWLIWMKDKDSAPTLYVSTKNPP